MAEDAEFIEAIEEAGLGFIGPSPGRPPAGAKDEAKKLARGLGNAVIPGVDDVSARALAPRRRTARPSRSSREHDLEFAASTAISPSRRTPRRCSRPATRRRSSWSRSRSSRARPRSECREIWSEYPSNRIRFKHIGGGGGKGQRVVSEARRRWRPR